MEPAPEPHPGYRPCVGILLLDPGGRLFVGRRSDVTVEAWQPPQGGIDPGEDPVTAGLRELREEVGTDRARLLRVSRGWRAYDLPAHLAASSWGGRYKGQTQRWLALRFEGEDADIRLDAHLPAEFAAWRWIAPAELAALAAPFKRAVYAAVLDEFADLLAPAAPAS